MMRTDQFVVIVNGRPGAGKDTTIRFMREFLTSKGIRSTEISSIDCVRDLLAAAGIDTSRKTDEDRDCLSEVGASLERHNSFMTRDVLNRLREFYGDQGGVAFVHIREKATIEKIEIAMNFRNFFLIKVTGSREITVDSNASDRDVDEITYDITIKNNGTLEQLEEMSHAVVKTYLLPGETVTQ